MKNKMMALLLVGTMCLGLTACGGTNTTESSGTDDSTVEDNAGASDDDGSTEENEGDAEENEGSAADATDGYLKDTITVAISADGGTLDPFASFVNWGTATLTGLVYQGLISMDYDYNIYYGIAKDIEQVDDLTWQLTIWDCVYDSEGSQITIDDVIWSYQQLIDSGNGGAIPKFDHWEKVDDYTANMILNEAFGDGDFEKHFGNSQIIDQQTYEAHGSDMTTTPVGTGPYKLADYTVGSEVVLEADENFWMNNVDVDNPLLAQNFKTIKYEVIQDASSRAIALEMGEVDIVDSMEAVDVANLSSNDAISTIDTPQRPPVAFSLNANSDSVCGSKELRQAICYALDNDAIAAALGVPATAVYGIQPNMVDAPESWTTGEGRDYYNYDVDKAKELIEAAGYNGETVTLMYVSSTISDAAAIMIQSQLREAGINVELYSVDQVTAMDYKYDPSVWDIRIDTMGGGAYLSQTIKCWWSEDVKDLVPEGSGWNTSLIADSTLDDLYVAVNQEASDANITAWDEYFNEQCYGYAICSYSTQTACSSELKNVYFTTNGGLQPNAFVLAD